MLPLAYLISRDAVGGVDNSQDRRPQIIAASVIGAVLAIASTIGRLAARRKTGAPVQSDDYLIIFGTFTALGVVASTLVMLHFGLGRHSDLVSDIPALAQSVVASQVIYALSVIPIKLSILALYHRLFPSPRLRNVCIAIGSVVIAYSLAQALSMVLQCIPLSFIWTPTEHAICIQADAMYVTMAVINVATDFIILTLPVRYIWRLSLQRARKIQLTAVFLLGALACAIGLVRAVVVNTAMTTDEAWNDVASAIWSEMEICIGVLSANLPCLRPLFYWLPHMLRGTTSNNAASGGSSSGVGGKGSKGAYAGGASKRLSGHNNAFEMGRRNRVTSAGWEELDSHGDLRPFARISEEKGPVASVHVQPVASSETNSTIGGAEGSGRETPQRMGPSPLPGHAPPANSIVVETRIETTYEGMSGEHGQGVAV